MGIWNVMYIGKYIKCWEPLYCIFRVTLVSKKTLVSCSHHVYFLWCVHSTFCSQSRTCVIKIGIFFKKIFLVWNSGTSLAAARSGIKLFLYTEHLIFSLGKRNILACPVSKSKLHNKAFLIMSGRRPVPIFPLQRVITTNAFTLD